jgi:hypothetical protein
MVEELAILLMASTMAMAFVALLAAAGMAPLLVAMAIAIAPA